MTLVGGSRASSAAASTRSAVRIASASARNVVISAPVEVRGWWLGCHRGCGWSVERLGGWVVGRSVWRLGGPSPMLCGLGHVVIGNLGACGPSAHVMCNTTPDTRFLSITQY